MNEPKDKENTEFIKAEECARTIIIRIDRERSLLLGKYIEGFESIEATAKLIGCNLHLEEALKSLKK